MAVAQPDETSAGTPRYENVEAVFAALESPLLGYAHHLVNDPAVAEDVVQEAFMKLHAQFKNVREPRQWLYRTAHNLAMNHLRQHQRIVPLPQSTETETRPDNDPTDPAPLPDEQIVRLEGIGLVRLSLETLDARSRELIRLKFHEDLSYKEMAERTGLTTGHVGYLLHHALKSIATELAKSGIVP